MIDYQPFIQAVQLGKVRGYTAVKKFGRATVGTTYTPVALGGNYRTPLAAAATALRIKAGGNAADTAAGAGARAVTLVGLDENFQIATETVATAGASASAATSTTFTRLYRFWVSASGTYATQAAGSHVGAITIENAAGTEDWGTIDAAATTGFPYGQSDIGCISIPVGSRALILGAEIYAEASKTVDLILFTREGINETAAPFSAMRAKYTAAIAGGAPVGLSFNVPIAVQGPADIGWMARVSSATADIRLDFGLLIVDDARAAL